MIMPKSPFPKSRSIDPSGTRQFDEGLPHGGPADFEVPHQTALSGQSVSGLQIAGPDLALDVLPHEDVFLHVGGH